MVHGSWVRGALRRLPAVVLGCVLAAATPAHAAPDPGGDPWASVPVPPPAGKFFGFHEAMPETSPHGWSAAELAEVAAGAGATTHRFTLNWWNVEPRRDVTDEATGWAPYQRLYDALLARGIRPLITIAGVPRWAVEPAYSLCGHRRECEYPPAPWMYGQWASFAGEVARRFPQAAAIEIWNEPNVQGFFKPNPNPWRYAAIVTHAYNGIKAANPGMTVLAGGLAPTQVRAWDLFGNLSRVPLKQFLDTAYAANPSIKDHMDGISFHTVFQAQDLGAGSLWAKVFEDVRTVAAEHGDAGIDLWLSETGLTTQGGQDVRPMNEREQALGLLYQYRKLMQMDDVRAMLIHTLANRVEVPATDFNREYGVIRSWSPFVPKLAYCGFAGRVDTPIPYGGCPRFVDPVPSGDGAAATARRWAPPSRTSPRRNRR
jgi:hypothetical protein